VSTGTVSRATVDVDGQAASYLTAGEGSVVLLLHGTYWSRVWLPVLERLAGAGLRPVAVDLPGCGYSAGELTLETATVPELAAWVERFHAALGSGGPVAIAGHDIGGALAQRLLVTDGVDVPRMALVNSVTYDSWPVPGVARYRDPQVVAATTTEDILAARRTALTTALARPASEDELSEYLAPWADARVARSWMALAGAADSRYTEELVGALRESPAPKLLVWGADDTSQPVTYAERFAAEMPRTTLSPISSAGHIPMENDPGAVADALAAFFTESP
jgi:pimeloyl-ACP methyl ester carboxylesterase